MCPTLMTKVEQQSKTACDVEVVVIQTKHKDLLWCKVIFTENKNVVFATRAQLFLAIKTDGVVVAYRQFKHHGPN